MLYVLAGLLALLQVSDAYLTEKVIQNGGHEANPVAKFLMKYLGRIGFYVAKGLLVAGTGFAAAYYGEQMSLFLLTAFYGWVTIHNFNVLESIKNKG